MTIVFDPGSWDRAIDYLESCDTTDSTIRQYLEVMPLTRTTYSPVDTALHVAGIQPISERLAIMQYVAGLRKDAEVTHMSDSVADYRETEVSTTIDARLAFKQV